MHVHKIVSDKHKEFLAQERKDPIIGDLIVENDEVVFCASCKSVFLKDTWFYLNKKHCEQSKTLKKFPSMPAIHLKVEETILFHKTLTNSIKGSARIPRETKKKPWIQEQIKISRFQTFFQHPIIKYTNILSWGIGLILFFMYKSPIVIFAFLFTFLIAVTEILHNWYFGNKSDTVYKIFKDNTFYVTNKSICFSEPYGINRYTLPLENVKEIFLQESDNFNLMFCKIYYNDDRESIAFSFPQKTLKTSNSYSFINTLKSITYSNNFPIHITSKSESLGSHVRSLINEGQTNFVLKQLGN